MIYYTAGDPYSRAYLFTDGLCDNTILLNGEILSLRYRFHSLQAADSEQETAFALKVPVGRMCIPPFTHWLGYLRTFSI